MKILLFLLLPVTVFAIDYTCEETGDFDLVEGDSISCGSDMKISKPPVEMKRVLCLNNATKKLTQCKHTCGINVTVKAKNIQYCVSAEAKKNYENCVAQVQSRRKDKIAAHEEAQEIESVKALMDPLKSEEADFEECQLNIVKIPDIVVSKFDETSSSIGQPLLLPGPRSVKYYWLDIGDYPIPKFPSTCKLTLEKNASAPYIELSSLGTKNTIDFLTALKEYVNKMIAQTLAALKSSSSNHFSGLQKKLQEYVQMRGDLMDLDFSEVLGIGRISAVATPEFPSAETWHPRIVLETKTTHSPEDKKMTRHFVMLKFESTFFNNLCTTLSLTR